MHEHFHGHDRIAMRIWQAIQQLTSSSATSDVICIHISSGTLEALTISIRLFKKFTESASLVHAMSCFLLQAALFKKDIIWHSEFKVFCVQEKSLCSYKLRPLSTSSNFFNCRCISRPATTVVVATAAAAIVVFLHRGW